MAVTLAIETAEVSERQACRYTGFARSTLRYQSRRPSRIELRDRLKVLAAERPRWGYRRLYRLLRREGLRVNRKLVQRVYREEGLTVRRRRRKRVAMPRTPLPAITRANERWSMDFVSDALSDGRRFRALTIVDDFTRESPAIEVDTSLPGDRVVRVLESLADRRGLPIAIVCDNGPEFRGEALDQWADCASTPKFPRSVNRQIPALGLCGFRMEWPLPRLAGIASASRAAARGALRARGADSSGRRCAALGRDAASDRGWPS